MVRPTKMIWPFVILFAAAPCWGQDEGTSTSTVLTKGLRYFKATMGSGSEDGTFDDVSLELSSGVNGQTCKTGVLWEGVLHNSWSSGDVEEYKASNQDFGDCGDFENDGSPIGFTIIKTGNDGLKLVKMEFDIGGEIYVWRGAAWWDPTHPVLMTIWHQDTITWITHPGLNCYPGHGADRAPEPYMSENFSLPQCKESCQHEIDCHGFIYGNDKRCHRIKNIVIDKCVQSTENANLYEKGFPDVSIVPSYRREKVGTEISIECIPGDSTSQITAWLKNGEVYSTTDDSNVIITKRPQPGDRSYLRILKAKPKDSANFSCVANNTAGTASSNSSQLVIYDMEHGKVKPISCNLDELLTPVNDGKEGDVSIKVFEDQKILNFVMNFSKSSLLKMNQVEYLKMNEIVLIEHSTETKYVSCNETDQSCTIMLPVLLNSKEIEIELWMNVSNKCKNELVLIKNFWNERDWNKYSAWTEWSTCSMRCGKGTQSRNRDCNLGQRKFCEKKYEQEVIQEQDCKKKDCKGKYGKWKDWGPCDINCIRTKNRPGHMNRTRECNAGSECEKIGQIETKNCFGEPDFNFCPINCTLGKKHERSNVIKTRYDLTVEILKPQDEDHPAKVQSLLLRKFGSNIKAAEVKWNMSDARTCYEAKPFDLDINYNCYLEEDSCVCRFHALRMRQLYSLTRIIYEETKSNSKSLDPIYCQEQIDKEDYWTCDNKSETIFFSQLCDENKDCTDGSDEEDALCKGDTMLLLKIGLPLAILLAVDIIIAFILIKFILQFKNLNKEEHFVSSVKGKDFFEKVYGDIKAQKDARKMIRNMGTKDIEQVIKISSTMEFYLHKKVLKLIRNEFGERKLLQFLYSSMKNRLKLKQAFDIVRPGVTDKLTHSIKLKMSISQIAIMSHMSQVATAASFTITPFRDIFKDCSIITILYYFSNEILQNDFARIGHLNLGHIVHLLIGIFVLTLFLRMWVEVAKFPDDVIDMNKYMKTLILIPGFNPSLHAAVCISLSWNIQSSKLKLAKLSKDPWDDDTWDAKIKEIQMIYSLEEKLVVMKNESRFAQGCENVVENFIQAIVTTILVMRGKLFNFFQSTITKRMPSVFTLLIIYSFLSLVLKARSYKSGFKQGLLSLGGIAQTLAICCSILQKTILYILASFQYTFFAVIMMGLVTCFIFVFNNIYNTMFASSSLVDRIAYSLVSAMIPITFTDWKMVKNSEEDEESDADGEVSYGQKRTFSQGFFIHLIHWMESALLIGVICAQQNLDDDYVLSLAGLFEENDVNLVVPFSVALAMISGSCHILGGLLNLTYYRIVHPWSAITQKYSMCDHFSICPEILVYNQTFDFHPDEIVETSQPVQLLSLRLPKSFKSKRKPKNTNVHVTNLNDNVDVDDPHLNDKVENVDVHSSPLNAKMDNGEFAISASYYYISVKSVSESVSE